MRKVREIFRLGLKYSMGKRQIGRSCSISHSTVGEYLNQAKTAGLSYDEIERMDDLELERLISNDGPKKSNQSRVQPNWEVIHQELKKKGVTLQLLWQEYKEVHPDGYQSSQFYELYSRWKKKQHVTMRQTHKAGEKMFVDYAGQSVPVIDRNTGQVMDAQIFVAVLGASNYTYAEASADQGLCNWIASHVRAFEYFEGVPQIVIPDNLRCGVSKSCRYEPDINPTYHDMATHYGTVIIPARVRKPKDKAKVEVGVQIVERWILAVLRNHTFFSLTQLNEMIDELLDKLNHRPFKKLEGSRHSCFEAVEKNALLPLPQSRYVFAEWKTAGVNIDYHVELNLHYYSVPYQLVRQKVQIRYTGTTVEIFHKGKRVASHIRCDRPGFHTTQKEHMPKSHQQHLAWPPSRIINWGATIGPSCAQVMETIMKSRQHPEQGYRSCLGILRLERAYCKDRLEAACQRAIAIRGCNYKSIRSILEKGLDKQPLPNRATAPKIEHKNIRGKGYYL
ncbi:MAG: IS21 family transposase [Desulfobacteraceae bacterium]|nr:MAG: IS21 family transposase [Desulfobacteraceae bacterium]